MAYKEILSAITMRNISLYIKALDKSIAELHPDLHKATAKELKQLKDADEGLKKLIEVHNTEARKLNKSGQEIQEL